MNGMWLIYAILPLLILLTWQQVGAMSPHEQLVQVRSELAKKRERLAQVRARESASVQKIKQGEAGMQQQVQLIRGAEKKIGELKTGIAKKQRSIAQVTFAKQQRENIRENRSVELYKQLLTQDQLADDPLASPWMVVSATYGKAALKEDRSVISGHTTQIVSLETETSRLQAGKQQQAIIRNSGQREYTKIEQENCRQKVVLTSVKQEQEKIAAEIKEYEAKQQRLKNLLARLTSQTKKQSKKSGGAGNKPGDTVYKPSPPMPADFAKFNLPVSGKIIRGYGVYRHPEWGTSTFSSGLTIAADAGAPIKSIAGGSVVYSGVLKGYGNIIIADHGQQVFSVYGHCGTMMKRVGAKIERGETIASVGTADDNTPSLYFELRSRGKAVNPAKWLVG